MNITTRPTLSGSGILTDINTIEILEMIESRRFGVSYEPILATQSERIYGYEALARFYNRSGEVLGCGPVFDGLHENLWLFYLVELSLKRLQFEHAPPRGRLFVNMDPHVFFVYDGADEDTNPFLSLFREREELVVEIMENSDIGDAFLSRRLLDRLKDANISAALDDLGHPQSLLSLDVLTGVAYLKFHVGFARRLRERDVPSLYLSLPAFARQNGIQTILEGVETPEDLARARELDFDFVQGFLFKEQGIQIPPGS